MYKQQIGEILTPVAIVLALVVVAIGFIFFVARIAVIELFNLVFIED